MTQTEATASPAVTAEAALAYLARRQVGEQWRGFLRALVETLDANLDRAGRDGLLRAVGARMAGALPLGPVETLAGLEARMNEAMAGMAWGHVALAVDEADRSLRLVHGLVPLLPVAGDEAGGWMAPVLQGLYGQWLDAQQGEAAGGASLGVVSALPGQLVLRFGP